MKLYILFLILLSGCSAVSEKIKLSGDNFRFEALFYENGSCEYSVNGVNSGIGGQLTRRITGLIGDSDWLLAEECSYGKSGDETLIVSANGPTGIANPIAELYSRSESVESNERASPVELPLVGRWKPSRADKKLIRKSKGSNPIIHVRIYDPVYSKYEIRHLSGNFLLAPCGYDLEGFNGMAVFNGTEEVQSTGIVYRLRGLLRRIGAGC